MENLSIVKVYNGAKDKPEYVELVVNADSNLAGYAICDKTYNADGESDIKRNFFFFPRWDVKKGDKIFVSSKTTKFKSKTDVAGHKFHWCETAVWNDQQNDKVFLVKFAKIEEKAVGTSSIPKDRIAALAEEILRSRVR